MPRNSTLLSLLQDYRAEIRASGNAAHNSATRDNDIRLLQRVQETLWDEHDWPHLRVRRTLDLQAGQRYYDTPEDLPIDRVELVEVRYGEEWVSLCPGIGLDHYAAFDSDLDERSWPVERWQVYEDDQIEIWPIPADNADATTLEGTLRLTGIRALNPLVADDDRADLDNRLIYLNAAAETLAASGAKDAPLKLRAAEKRKAKLLGNQSKIKSFSMFGGAASPARRLRGPARVHYRSNET